MNPLSAEEVARVQSLMGSPGARVPSWLVPMGKLAGEIVRLVLRVERMPRMTLVPVHGAGTGLLGYASQIQDGHFELWISLDQPLIEIAATVLHEVTHAASFEADIDRTLSREEIEGLAKSCEGYAAIVAAPFAERFAPAPPAITEAPAPAEPEGEDDEEEDETDAIRPLPPPTSAKDVITDTQTAVLEALRNYRRVTDEAPPLSLLARKLGRSRKTLQGHLDRLHAKGFLLTPTTAGLPRTIKQ